MPTPLFRFHLVTEGEREHVGSMALPSRGETPPAGLQIAMRILARIVGANDGDERVALQATDDTGAVVYDFDVRRRAKDADRPKGYVH